jgi:methionyl-tRNA formyltransferase
MAVEKGLDTGPIYAVGDTTIDEHESVEELRARLVEIGCRLLIENLSSGVAGLPIPRDQVGEPTYAEKIRPEELELHWERDANHLSRLVRLGRAWTTFRGRRLRVLEAAVEPWVRAEAAVSGEPVDASKSQAATGAAAPEGASPGALSGEVVTAGEGTHLRLIRVQPEGKQPMSAADWLRGARPGPGERLGREG